jgi:hypothetical protein
MISGLEFNATNFGTTEFALLQDRQLAWPEKYRKRWQIYNLKLVPREQTESN